MDGSATSLSPERSNGRSPQRTSQEVQPQQSLASSEITTEVYYLGAIEVEDSKSIPAMVGAIKDLKGRHKSSAPGRRSRLVEFRLKRDQLTLYESAKSSEGGQDGDERQSRSNKKKKRAGSISTKQHIRQGDVPDDSWGSPNQQTNSQNGDRVPIFRVRASSISMCLQESLYGSKSSSSSSQGTDHFALNMTEVAPIRMTGGQVIPRRVHWCHVFRAKNHTEVSSHKQS